MKIVDQSNISRMKALYLSRPSSVLAKCFLTKTRGAEAMQGVTSVNLIKCYNLNQNQNQTPNI